MPVITETGEDGVVTAWMVDEGARVTAGTLIAEVQAEKVAEEVRAPGDGVVRDLVAINEPVPQGEPICRIATADETAPPAAPSPPPAERILASPSAKRVARELGVDLSVVSGTGPGGRITEADVRTAASREAPGLAMTGTRAVIARNMRESAQSTASVTLTSRADVTDSLPDRITARVVAATAVALREHPALNGHRRGDRFVPGAGVHVSLAIQTDDGLTAPIVRDADTKSLEVLAKEIEDLAARARSKVLTAVDFEGGTFSVTNLGSYGIDAFTPVINPPQMAILGVGAVRTEPGFDDTGAVVARRYLVLSLTFDHAFVDGAPAAAFLADVRGLLETGNAD